MSAGSETTMDRNQRRHESGAALLVTVLLLALMGIVGLSSMDTVMRDRQIAGFQRNAKTALYAAEAGVAHAVGIIRTSAQALAVGGEAALEGFDPAFPGKGTTPVQSLGSQFPAPGSPRYMMDPNASDPNDGTAPAQAIRYMGKGDVCPGWIMSQEEGSPEWAEALWDIRVRGDNPSGTVVNIQATGTSCHPYNN